MPGFPSTAERRQRRQTQTGTTPSLTSNPAPTRSTPHWMDILTAGPNSAGHGRSGGEREPPSVPLTPLAPQVVSFAADSSSVVEGTRITLSWQVNHASSVTVDELGGPFSSTGKIQDQPAKSTTYHLKVNGVQVAETKVEVKERKAPQPPPRRDPMSIRTPQDSLRRLLCQTILSGVDPGCQHL